MPTWQNRVITGVVESGFKRGRTLGFPTANVALTAGAEPPHGVYAVFCRLMPDRTLSGVANVGIRPTLGLTIPLLEVHLFDFCEDIYGHRLETRLVRRLRDERKFSGLDELKRQLEDDALRARTILLGNLPGRAEFGEPSTPAPDFKSVSMLGAPGI